MPYVRGNFSTSHPATGTAMGAERRCPTHRSTSPAAAGASRPPAAQPRRHTPWAIGCSSPPPSPSCSAAASCYSPSPLSKALLMSSEAGSPIMRVAAARVSSW
jgi:hypothetical protein